jgi:hypothetical protein
LDIPCEKHGSHKIWEMAKRWVERENIRTREAYCPEDDRYRDPIACWTGSTWILVPGRGVTSAWCREEGKEISLEDVETMSREERKGTVVYALCPSCGSHIAKRNRWKYWEPLFRRPQ